LRQELVDLGIVEFLGDRQEERLMTHDRRNPAAGGEFALGDEPVILDPQWRRAKE
jgi:hypothetical protein